MKPNNSYNLFEFFLITFFCIFAISITLYLW